MANDYRRLSAIMFTDIVGYSALTQKNEELALDLLKEHREILRQIFPKHNGKEIETAGDSFFVEFSSALEASKCAVEIQENLHKRNQNVPEKRQILLRIGLHVGDVVHIDEHVHGDGVNLAARLEPIASPGGICISEDVERQIENKIEYPLLKLGKQKLKNIKLPVDVYKIKLPWEPVKKSKFSFNKSRSLIYILLMFLLIAAAFFIWQSTQNNIIESGNRIAVLPFDNISQNSEDEYLADGMTEELISNLAKIKGLDVIARTSAMKYKGVKMDVAEIGKDLNVGTILEGSVRKYLDNMRITVQLIDAKSQKHLWSHDYDKKLKDVFSIQKEIAEKVASELRIKFLDTEKGKLETENIKNLDAYRFYLLGRYNLNKRSIETIHKALQYFSQAIELQHDYARAYTGLADCYALIGGAGYGNMDPVEAINKSKESALKALELDNQLAEAYTSLAYIKFRFDWSWNEAEDLFIKAIALKPGYSIAHEWYGLYLLVLGRSNEAMYHMLRAEALDPLSPSVRNGVGKVYEFSKQNEKAIDQYNKIINTNPEFAEAHSGLGSCYFDLKQYDKSIDEMKKAVKLSGGRLLLKAALAYLYGYIGRKKEAEELLNDFKQQSHISPSYLGIIYIGLGEKDKAIEYLYKSYEKRESGLIYLKTVNLFDPLRNDKRFKELLKKIGLEED